MSALLPSWGWAVILGTLGVILLASGITALFRLLGRSFLAFLFLALLGQTGLMPGFLPGANLLNALVLGTLGAPGFALLVALPWLLG